MGLIDLVASHRQQETQAAWDTYVRLLEANTETPKAVDQMRAAMATLGKTAEDLPRDRQTILDVRRLQQAVAKGSGIDDDRAAAQQRVVDSEQQIRQKTEAMRLEHMKLVLKAKDLEEWHLAAQKASHELDRLRQSAPEIVDRVE